MLEWPRRIETNGSRQLKKHPTPMDAELKEHDDDNADDQYRCRMSQTPLCGA